MCPPWGGDPVRSRRIFSFGAHRNVGGRVRGNVDSLARIGNTALRFSEIDIPENDKSMNAEHSLARAMRIAAAVSR
jgi:hypothetical protein